MKNANPVSGGRRCALLLLLALAGCGKVAPGRAPSIPPPVTTADAPVAYYTYEVVATWPHDPAAFTQGLVFRNGSLLESTGLNGQSTLREVDPASGRVVKEVAVPRQYFAEGLAVIGSRAFQLTWQNQVGFVYDADTFQKLQDFRYTGEGWGLTTDGHDLILSNGTNRIAFLDAATFGVVRTIDVTSDGKPVQHLNELEYIRGEIFANVWQTDTVVRIDPARGVVHGMIDFSGLLSPAEHNPQTDVLNGIAYDAATDRLFVTGKRWPKIFQVRLRAKP